MTALSLGDSRRTGASSLSALDARRIAASMSIERLTAEAGVSTSGYRFALTRGTCRPEYLARLGRALDRLIAGDRHGDARAAMIRAVVGAAEAALAARLGFPADLMEGEDAGTAERRRQRDLVRMGGRYLALTTVDGITRAELARAVGITKAAITMGANQIEEAREGWLDAHLTAIEGQMRRGA